MDSPPHSSIATIRLAICYWGVLLGIAVAGGSDFHVWNWCLVFLAVGGIIWCLPPWQEAVPDPMLFRWAVILFPVYIALQLIPIPLGILAVLSPERVRLLSDLQQFGGVPSSAPLTSIPAQTWDQLLRICSYVVVFFVVRSATWRLSRERDWFPVFCLLAIALVETVLGLLQASSGRPDALAQGSYANRNHFAGLLEMALPMAAAFALAKLPDQRHHDEDHFGTNLLSVAGLLIAAGLLVGVMFSTSKSGLLGALAGLFVAVGCSRLPSLSRGKRIAAVGALAVALLGVFFLLPDSRVVEGFGNVVEQGSGSDLEGRLPMWGDAVRLWAAYPVFGSGAGTFPTVYTKFQTSSVDMFVLHAHNDYLEFLSDLGVAGAALLFVILATAYCAAWKVSFHHESRNLRHLGIGCAGAMTAIFLHSLTDFNMFHRGNAMFLVWISAMAMGLAASMDPPAPTRSAIRFLAWFFGGGTWSAQRSVAALAPVLLCCLLLVVYAPAWLWYLANYSTNPAEEKRFCQYGICDTDGMLAAQTTPEQGYSAVPIPDLLESVRRDPTSHSRWHYLCEALELAERNQEAAACLANVVKRAPELAGENTLLARYYAGRKEQDKALELLGRVLSRTSLYDHIIFSTMRENHYPVPKVLSILPPGERAPVSYLRSVIRDENVEDAKTVWAWMRSRKFGGDRIAVEYTAFLARKEKYNDAAAAWAAYLGERADGYFTRNLVFNGGFEKPDARSAFDWKLISPSGVTVQIDPTVAKEGSRSAVIHFTGEENVNFHHILQSVYVLPGTYRFEAYIKTEKLTSAEGIGFAIGGPSVNFVTNTLLGTNDWTKIEKTFSVPKETAISIVVNRNPVQWKFDAKIDGTAWVDAVSLTRVR